MKIPVILFFLLIAIGFESYGQKEIDENTGWSFKDRSYTGLGFGGLGFGTHPYYGSYFSAGLSAIEGFMLTKNMSTGVGLHYQFTSYSKPKAQNHLIGFYPFLRYNIRNFFIQADYTIYRIEGDLMDSSSNNLADRFFVGLGYFSTGRPGMNFLFSYDFLYTNMGPWASPYNTRLFFSF